jgi:hypothetical protein
MLVNYKKWRKLVEQKSDYAVDRQSNAILRATGIRSESDYVKVKNVLEAKPSEIKKLRLIFPKSDWEVYALKLIKSLGIITHVFESLASATRTVNNLVSKKVKIDELIVGSHGEAANLLITKKGEMYPYNKQFLDSLKPLINPGAKVFFTACHGADYLVTIKEAAERLGNPVYGSAGIYNYVTNSSEKGFYWASSKYFKIPRVKEQPVIQKDEADLGIIKLNFLVKKEKYEALQNSSLDKFSAKLTFTEPIFGAQLPPLELVHHDHRAFSLNNFHKDGEYRLTYSIKPTKAITDFIDREVRKNLAKWGPVQKQAWADLDKSQKLVYDRLTSGKIKIEVTQFGGSPVSMQLVPGAKLQLQEIVDNEFLLANGLCKKVDKAPISWI